MRVEIINTGTELLLGYVDNTHLGLFGRALLPLGLRIERQIAVPDGEAIRDALLEAFNRAEILVVTGGLGPTSDDVTRDIAADLLGLELLQDQSVLGAIETRFRERKLTMPERVRRQAQVPRGATILPNPNGTAPGLYMPRSKDSPHLFLLPGPPRELVPMLHEHVIPLLRQIVPPSPNLQCKIYRVVGMPELGVELGFCARAGEIDVRCIGTPEMVAEADRIIRARLQSHVATDDERSLEELIVEMLTRQERTFATAESCTGGLIAHRITNVPGASAVFLHGFVTYSNDAKINLLQIDPKLLKNHGAVSHEVACAMAENARRLCESDFALATTGIAGPSGGTEQKPVGTLYVALAFKDHPATIERHMLKSDRETFKSLAAQAALDLLRRKIIAYSSDRPRVS
jgi:nicotinamide-nucleotide amidase